MTDLEKLAAQIRAEARFQPRLETPSIAARAAKRTQTQHRFFALAIVVLVALPLAFVVTRSQTSREGVVASNPPVPAAGSTTPTPSTTETATSSLLPVPTSGPDTAAVATTTSPPSTTPTTVTPTTTAPPTTKADPMTGTGTSPQSGPGNATGAALLRAVRVDRHEGFDRVVFEFTQGTPGYDVQYIDKPVIADPSSQEVPLLGGFALQIRMSPASGVDLTATDAPGGYVETYTGPKRIVADTSEVTEIVQTGDFEAVLNWTIGTRSRADFRVSTLSGPGRLVIDIRNA